MNHQQYQDFLKSLKVVFTNCSVYSADHPVFAASVDSFRAKLKEIIDSQGSLVINIKPDSLIVGRQEFKDNNLYKELAESLHQRKIKSIKIIKGVSGRELIEFLAVVSAPARDILARGQTSNILKEKEIKNIIVEDLDYSQLIKGRGQQVEDIWNYLFNLADNASASLQADEFLEKFRITADEFGIKEVLEDEKLSFKLIDYFSKLKEGNRDVFDKSIKNLSRAILNSKGLKKLEEKEKAKKLFSSLSHRDLAALLSESFRSGRDFDPAAFSLFFSLLGSETHKQAAAILKKEKKHFNIDKMKKLFSSLKGTKAGSLYGKNLLASAPEESQQKEFYFDQPHLSRNYRLILLDLLYHERKPQHLDLIIERIFSQAAAGNSFNYEFIKKFAQVYKEKTTNPELSAALFAKSKKIWALAEKNVFSAEDPGEFNFLLDTLDCSALDVSFYLNKMLREKQINPLVLKLFFKFFPEHVVRLHDFAGKQKNDFIFLKKLIKALSRIDHPLAAGLLKHIFYLTPLAVKIEILDIMKGYSGCDRDFLFSLAKSHNFDLRQKSFELASRFGYLNKAWADNLFFPPNIFGINSHFILRNLDILKGIYVLEFKPCLEKLAGRRFFWNKKIREAAKEVLKIYCEREN